MTDIYLHFIAHHGLYANAHVVHRTLGCTQLSPQNAVLLEAVGGRGEAQEAPNELQQGSRLVSQIRRSARYARLAALSHAFLRQITRGLPACCTPLAPHTRHTQTEALCSPGARCGWVTSLCPLPRPQWRRQAASALVNRSCCVAGGGAWQSLGEGARWQSKS